MLRLFGYINITNGDVALNREQAGLENNELALGGVHEVGKAPRQTTQRVVEKRIDGARKGIVAIINIVLIGLPAVLGRSLVKPGNRHRTDILLECEVGGVALVIELVAADNANGIDILFNILDDVGGVVGGCHIGVGNGLAAKDTVFHKVDGTGFLIVKDYEHLAFV